MHLEGHCYCGRIRFVADGDPGPRLQCHCRECQYISGGGPNFVVAMPVAGFRYTAGTPAAFTRDDLPAPVTREFCGVCGTPLLTRSPRMPDVVLIKAGTLDDPALYGLPDAAIFTVDRQPFHAFLEGVPAYPRKPG